MKKVFVLLIPILILKSLLLHAQGKKVEGFEAVELPCFAVKDTIEFHLPISYRKEKTRWYGEGFIETYKFDSGAELHIICGFSFRPREIPVESLRSGKRRKGVLKKKEYFWREEYSFGFMAGYAEVKEDEKALFDSIINEIIAQVKKE